MKRIRYALMLLLSLAALSCSDTEEPIDPVPPAPSLTLGDKMFRNTPTPGEIALHITRANPQPGDTHRVESAQEWIRIGEIGSDAFAFDVAENVDRQRSGYLTVQYAGLAPQRVRIVQAAAGREEPETDQTVLFYLSGQSLLRYFRDTNVAEIRKVIEGGTTLCNSRVLVFIQPSVRESLLIEYAYDAPTRSCTADTLRRYSGLSSVRQEDIVRVFCDMRELAPANRYGLVMGSHGGGWVPAEYKNLNLSEDDSEQEWSLGARRHGAADWLGRLPGADATRWFGENDYATADIETWSAAFAEAAIGWEYAVFDACFMSNIETLYELRHAARYIVGSPCEIMGRGMPYATMMADLFVDEGRSYDLEAFCRHFHEYYSTTTETRRSGCIALTVCSELDELARRMKAVNGRLRPDADFSGLQIYEGLNRPLFFDLGQYVETVCADEALAGAFRTQFDRTFPESHRLHTPSFYSGYNGRMNEIHTYSGVTTSAPSTKFPTAYAATAWSRATAAE